MKRLLALGAAILLCVAGILLIPESPEQPAPQKSGEQQSKSDTFELAGDRQKFIWDTEHLTFQLETKFGKPLAAALAERSSDKVRAFLRSDFQAQIPAGKVSETTVHSVISESRMGNESEEVRRVSADEFSSYLIDGLADFGEVERSRLRVLTISQDSSDPSLWRSDFLVTADGKDRDGNPIHWHLTSHAAYFVSEEAQTVEMPLLADWAVISDTTRQSKQRLFEEVTKSAGLSDLPVWDNWKLPRNAVEQYRLQAAVADYNQDGYPDIAAGSIEGRPLLLLSEKGESYRDVVFSYGVSAWQSQFDLLTTLAASMDFNNDGFPDLILGNRIYRNDQGREFVDVTDQSGITFRQDPMGCAIADYDCDGDLDVYVLYQASEDGHSAATAPWVGDVMSGRQNELWQNEGSGRFRNVTEEAGVGGGARHSFAASWFFFDEDHYPDLYVANDFGANVLLRNSGDGTFEDVSATAGVSDYATSMGVCTGDLDNDGNSEIYVANMYSKMGRRIIGQVCDSDYPQGIFPQIEGSCTGNRLYTRKGAETKFREVSEDLHINAVGWAYAPAVIDVDSDGWLDLYATTGFLSFDRQKPDG